MTYYKFPKITDDQKQIIHGTILGGSSIIRQKNGKNCYLSMRGRNQKWIECKAQELNFIAPPNPYCQEKNGYFRWHSKSSPLLTEWYNLFYKDDKRTISMNILDELRDIGLAIWFLDCGKLKNKEIVLNLDHFGNKEIKIISQYFKEISLNNKIQKSNIKLNKEASEKFIKVIGIHIPEFMYWALDQPAR